MLVRGDRLSDVVRREVLSAYVYRNTVENPRGAVLTGTTLAPVTDAEWLRTHAFHVVADGSRLSHRTRRCELVLKAAQ